MPRRRAKPARVDQPELDFARPPTPIKPARGSTNIEEAARQLPLLLELADARAQFLDDLERLPALPGADLELAWLWLRVGLCLLDVAASEAPADVDRVLAARLRNIAAAGWGGAWAAAELERRGGPSLRAVHFRVAIEGGWLATRRWTRGSRRSA